MIFLHFRKGQRLVHEISGQHAHGQVRMRRKNTLHHRAEAITPGTKNIGKIKQIHQHILHERPFPQSRDPARRNRGSLYESEGKQKSAAPATGKRRTQGVGNNALQGLPSLSCSERRNRKRNPPLALLSSKNPSSVQQPAALHSGYSLSGSSAPCVKGKRLYPAPSFSERQTLRLTQAWRQLPAQPCSQVPT